MVFRKHSFSIPFSDPLSNSTVISVLPKLLNKETDQLNIDRREKGITVVFYVFYSLNAKAFFGIKLDDDRKLFGGSFSRLTGRATARTLIAATTSWIVPKRA